jgi:hypothetical protein
MRYLRAGLKEIHRLGRDLPRIRRLAMDPAQSLSYFPDEPRKSNARILADLLLWRILRNEVNDYYFCWGMDRVHGPDPTDLLSYRRFRALRDAGNRRADVDGFSYLALTRDKYLFALLMQALGYPTPRLLALLEPDSITWLEPRLTAPFASLADAVGVDAYCKPRYGERGRGVFRLQVDGGEVLINGEPASLEDVAGRIRKKAVLQQRLIQHADLALLHPSSVNTLRLITVRDATGTRMFSLPLLRIGFGGSVVDNGAGGGIQVFVDPTTGRLRGPGLKFRGGTVSRHPDSGIDLDGFEVPHYACAVDLSVRLHGELPGLHTVGWDLAITADGPVFIEGNDNWAAGLRIGRDPTFKREFTQLFAGA